MLVVQGGNNLRQIRKVNLDYQCELYAYIRLASIYARLPIHVTCIDSDVIQAAVRSPTVAMLMPSRLLGVLKS
jgi:hypothetical protein